ncbi:MAG: hypothetical protein ACI9FR_001713 [Cryomorphaceae bacterium]|jgi:hypothetical protein
MLIENPNRRNFVKVAAASLAAIPVFANAQTLEERLAEDDPTAMALSYKEKSTEVDSAKHANHNDTQLCSNCSLYTGGADPWGGCAIFPGKLVAADGWCAAYAAKPT